MLRERSEREFQSRRSRKLLIVERGFSDGSLAKELKMLRREIVNLNETFGKQNLESPSKERLHSTHPDVIASSAGQRSVSAPHSQPIEAPKPPSVWRKGDTSLYNRPYYSPQAESGPKSRYPGVYPNWWIDTKGQSESKLDEGGITGKVTEYIPPIVSQSRVKVRHHLDATQMRDMLHDSQGNSGDRKLQAMIEKMNQTVPAAKSLTVNDLQPTNTLTTDISQKPINIKTQQKQQQQTKVDTRFLKKPKIGRIASQKNRETKRKKSKGRSTKVLPHYLRNVESRIKEFLIHDKLQNKGAQAGREDQAIGHHGLYEQKEDLSGDSLMPRDLMDLYHQRWPMQKDLSYDRAGLYSGSHSSEEDRLNQGANQYRQNERYNQDQRVDSRISHQNLLDIANSFLRSPLMQKFSSPETQNRGLPSNRSRNDSSALLVNVTAFDPKISLIGRPQISQPRARQSYNVDNDPLLESLPARPGYLPSRPTYDRKPSSTSSSNFSNLILDEEMKDFYQKEYFERKNSSSVRGDEEGDEDYVMLMGIGPASGRIKYSETSSNASDEQYMLNPRKAAEMRERENLYNIFKRDGIDVSHLLKE
eukprot:TRINITY_DN4339_c0_g1_i4.p1 TRINITY_DN4339_c0_g1~~TRINITY_DN4339_c0_g1_i4.p1  ORF type:complete len:589 (+),score=94.05 TRINITY_DN4339_c0_g1_i4:114-1880(+)